MDIELVELHPFFQADYVPESCQICRHSLSTFCVHCLSQPLQNQNQTQTEPNKTIEQMFQCPTTKGSCQHIFHDHCLNHWLAKYNICPTCSIGFIPSDRMHFYESKERTELGNVLGSESK